MCYQADYDNDGHLDVFDPARGMAALSRSGRAAAEQRRRRRSTDVTDAGGLDGRAEFQRSRLGRLRQRRLNVDLFIACEQQDNRLYRNKGDGTFEDVADEGWRAGQSESLLQGLQLDRL